MAKDLISVIMPVWKPDMTQLDQSVKSILNQTHSNLELIIIYKKSTGETDSQVWKMVDENKNDARIRLIEDESSFVDALNLGIKLAKGTQIGRMDSDDICVKTRFEEQLEFMEKSDVSLIGSWAYSISHDGKTIGTIEPPYKPDDIRKKIMFHNPILHPSVLMRKKMLDEIGRYDPNFFGAEDYELYLRAISKNYKIANIPKHLIYLRENNQSIMRGNRWKLTRKTYIKAKNTALIHYGLNKYYDVFYCMVAPLTMFVSPKMAFKIKTTVGWNKTMNQEN
jgi:glycosyltransferase involved in cell wall biosynthesis